MNSDLKLADLGGASLAEMPQIFGAKIPNIQSAQKSVKRNTLLNLSASISNQIVICLTLQRVVRPTSL
jgi:hypothetical protein